MSRKAVFLFAFLFVNIIYSVGNVIAQEDNQKDISYFHKAHTIPEKWLNDTFLRISADDLLAPLSVIQRGLSEHQKKERLRFFTQDLLAAWKEKNAQSIHDNCKGQSNVEQSCGLGYDPLFCAQDFPETELFYHTYRKAKNSEFIAVKWEEDKEVVAFYKLLKIGKDWKLDGIFCSQGSSFNFGKSYVR